MKSRVVCLLASLILAAIALPLRADTPKDRAIKESAGPILPPGVIHVALPPGEIHLNASSGTGSPPRVRVGKLVIETGTFSSATA
jgi:hypothetical protein